MLCHLFALSAFMLLRKDRPDWPRPIKLRRVWLVVAAACLAANVTMLAFGLAEQELVALLGGYKSNGGPFFLGIGILVISVLLFFYRRAVQDRRPITLRDADTPSMPTLEQRMLLEAEM